MATENTVHNTRQEESDNDDSRDMEVDRDYMHIRPEVQVSLNYDIKLLFEAIIYYIIILENHRHE